MFIILSYDINKKRVGKVLRICRKYLAHVHRSVFEGRLTEGQLKRLKMELEKIIDPGKDSVCIYCMESIKYTTKGADRGRSADISYYIKKSVSLKPA